jgi:hypothetical protein
LNHETGSERLKSVEIQALSFFILNLKFANCGNSVGIRYFSMVFSFFHEKLLLRIVGFLGEAKQGVWYVLCFHKVKNYIF